LLQTLVFIAFTAACLYLAEFFDITAAPLLGFPFNLALPCTIFYETNRRDDDNVEISIVMSNVDCINNLWPINEGEAR
jgi:hypothetical protein